MFLRQSTAAEVPLGPFIDETDGTTPLTSLTIAQADVRLKKGGAAWAQKNDTGGATHEEAGWYEAPLNTTDTGTAGPLMMAVHKAGALPVRREFIVLPAVAYDALVAGTGAGLRSDVRTFGGTAGTFSAGRPEVNATHLAGQSLAGEAGSSFNTVFFNGGVGLALADLQHVATLAASVITSTVLATSAANKVRDAIRTYEPSSEAAGTVGARWLLIDASVQAAIDAADGATLQAEAAASSASAAHSVAVAVQAVTDKVDTMLVVDGAAYQLTEDSLLNSPVGEGGFATTDRTKLEDIHGKLPTKTTLTGTTNADGDIQLDEATGVTFPTNFGALGINGSGHVTRVVLTDTASVLTNHTPQTGDVYALANGVNGFAAIKTDTAAVKTQTDQLAFTSGEVHGRVTSYGPGQDPATYVLTASSEGHAAGTIGNKINAAGAAGDPLSSLIPGEYAAGTAGFILGNNLDAKVSEVEGGAGGFAISPILATANQPFYATRNLPPIAQGSAPIIVWTIIDSRKEPIDLSGKDLRLVAYTRSGEDDDYDPMHDDDPFDATLTPAFKYETGSGGDLSIGGDDNNQITLTHDDENTADIGRYRYWLWNITDNVPLAHGRMPIEPAVKDV